MDIDYLLFLQNLREATGGALDSFFTAMSNSVNLCVIVIAAIYWCIDKKFGETMLFVYALNRIGNGLMKQICCVYRPWVKCPDIHPLADMKAGASGYSFPSGHTTNAMVLYGTPIFRKDIGRAFRALMILMIFLVALARNYFCVHTPQDVIMSMVLGLVCIWISYKVMDYVDRNPGKDWLVALLGVLLSVGSILYVAFKSYPIDYDAAGNLIVDPRPMQLDTYKYTAAAAMIFLGWFVERRWIRFSEKGTFIRRATRFLWAGLGYILLSTWAIPAIKNSALPKEWGIMLSSSLHLFYVVIFVPLLIVLIEGREKK